MLDNDKSAVDKKVASYIGLAQRAGAVLYGYDLIAERLSKAKLVLIDSRAPQKFSQKLKAKCDGKQLPVFVIDKLKENAHKDNIYAISVTSDSLAEAIINLLR